MLKTRFFSICIFLCVTLSANRVSASDYYSTAYNSLKSGQFYNASIEFEKAIFYETDNTRIAQYKYFKSLCYKGLGETNKALETLEGINLFNLPDSLFFLIRYEKAYCNFLNNEPAKSIWIIDEIKYSSTDTARLMEIIPLNILCLNAQWKWEETKELWNHLLENTGIPESRIKEFELEINNLYKKRNTPKYHSPKTAKNLSRFIPGLGQVYCGAIGEGSFNFIMNAAILGFAFYEFYTKYYITGYVVGLSLLNKTYNGSLHRAELLAEDKNTEDINEFNLEANSILLRILNK